MGNWQKPYPVWFLCRRKSYQVLVSTYIASKSWKHHRDQKLYFYTIIPRICKARHQEYLPFSLENWKFWMENQIVRASLFGKYQKIWAMILGDSIFLLFLVYLTDLKIHCSGSFSHHIKFRIVLCIYYMFMHYKISTRVVCVNGMHARSEVLSTPQLPPTPTPAPVPAVFSLLILRYFNSAHY